MSIIRNASVAFSPIQMFDLVNDIEQYPHFLPWCTGAHVLNTSAERVHGSLSFAKGPWQQSFSTENQLLAPERVDMRLLNGPFKHLQGTWRFMPIAQLGTRVSLELNYEFQNGLLAFTLGPIVPQMATTIVQAFTARANTIYGK